MHWNDGMGSSMLGSGRCNVLIESVHVSYIHHPDDVAVVKTINERVSN